MEGVETLSVCFICLVRIHHEYGNMDPVRRVVDSYIAL